ncbi:MAG TPA: hypothetical protein VKE94_06115 [Gemmataceae bacterium]|nr:hypothetical protein [Gemmataceae bacterium]
MSPEIPIAMVPPAGSIQELPPAPQPPHVLAAPTPEQGRAVDSVFAQQQQESAAVANLLGLYTSGMLLHNLMTDSLAPSADEAKKLPRLRVEEEEPEE